MASARRAVVLADLDELAVEQCAPGRRRVEPERPGVATVAAASTPPAPREDGQRRTASAPGPSSA